MNTPPTPSIDPSRIAHIKQQEEPPQFSVKSKTSFELMQETGFIGCFEAEADFSERSEESLRAMITESRNA